MGVLLTLLSFELSNIKRAKKFTQAILEEDCC